MDNAAKLKMMEKMLREIEDITHSQTSLLKKIAQLEADNINLGNRHLEKRLPDMHEKVDESLTEANALLTEFQELKNKFVIDNKLEEVLPEA